MNIAADAVSDPPTGWVWCTLTHNGGFAILDRDGAAIEATGRSCRARG